MLSAHRRGMQKTRGIRRIRERKMNSRTIKLTILTSIGAIALTGCVTDPVTGERKISKAAIGGVGGALGGYLLGDLIGGKNSRTEEIVGRSEEHTSELQSLMRISYAVFCLKK